MEWTGFDLGSWFAKLFRSTLPIAKNILLRLPQILYPLQYMIWGLGRILKKMFHKISGPVYDPFPSDLNLNKAEKI